MNIYSRLNAVRLPSVTVAQITKHFFLCCPRFAAQRMSLVASAERICGHAWLESNDQMKIFYILNGLNNMNLSSNFNFFREVQSLYIIATNRFSPLQF